VRVAVRAARTVPAAATLDRPLGPNHRLTHGPDPPIGSKKTPLREERRELDREEVEVNRNIAPRGLSRFTLDARGTDNTYFLPPPWATYLLW
jgi:hypothetical protein